MNVFAPSTLSNSDILDKAMKRALGGGLPGAMAMVVQVFALLPMRTTLNYSYRYKTGSVASTFKTLYSEGGIPRFYKGLQFALFQGPLARFGDTAANTGTLALLDSYDYTKNIPTVGKTAMASAAAAMWRINLMPIDACKTILQVEGSKGLKVLFSKVKKSGPSVLYHGAGGTVSATWVGHFPWFAVHNLLNVHLPQSNSLATELLRNATMGFSSSIVSDTCSNSLRILKTMKQTYPTSITYKEAAAQVIKEDGLFGLFFRGLKTRILANGMQSIMFTVLWKGFEKRFFSDDKKKPAH